ncbi:MAG TPA: DUF2330 domain-containing protein [archaeon]|nr:DUF2330 domain-containing protein [archaeon]
MDDPETVIDHKMLKVLADDTRMGIVKELSRNPMTPSDLGRRLSKSNATIVEHLDKLRDSGLVKKIESPGRKWVFYELTDSGISIVSSKSRRIVIIFAVSFLALMLVGSLLGSMFYQQAGTLISRAPTAESQKELPVAAPESIQEQPKSPLVYIAAVSLLLAVYIAKKTKFKLDKMKKVLLTSALLLMIFLSFSPFVKADGMVIPHIYPYEPLEENQQVAAISYQDGLEKMIISVNFNMVNISEAAWIFPVPANPNKVVIDVVNSFPQFSGQDVIQRAKSDVDSAVQISQLTQIYPMLPYFFFYGARTVVIAGVSEQTFGRGLAGAPSVTVYEHLEKEGITTEIVTARTGEALYWYLNNRGYNLPTGSISVLDDYIGEDYTFVISWVTSPALIGGSQYPYYDYPYARQPGIFVTFPTDKPYFPLVPTSVYGSKRIPIRIYLMGFATPEVSGEVESYTTTSYYVQDYFYNSGEFREFFGSQTPSSYTKVEIYVPSKYLTDDLWFKQETPAKVSYAMVLYSAFSKNPLPTLVVFILGVSALTGAVAGFIVFREWKKYALIGLTNLLSIVFVAIAMTAVKTKKIDESLKERIRKEGLMVINTDNRKLVFLVIFSIGFLIMGALIGFLLKVPLM